jgi:tetratricopeptide (TPR) repeat protein
VVLAKSRVFGACVVSVALLVPGCSGGGKQSTPTLGIAPTPLQTESPNAAYGWYHLGVVAEGKGRHQEAESDFLKANGIDPKYEAPLYALGLLHFHADDIPEAISDLGKAVTLDPRDACAHWALGLALVRGDGPAMNERGAKELRAALDIDPALRREVPPTAKPNVVPGCN